MSIEIHEERAQHRRTRHRKKQSAARQQMWVFVALGALLAIPAHAHPTGHAVIDAIYRAGFAALVAAAAGHSRRGATLVMAAIALAFSRSWWIAPAAIGLLVAFASAFQPRRRRRVGAAVGAISAVVLLHLHPVWFHGSTALATAVAVIPVLISAYRVLGRRAKRICRRVALGLAVAAVICTLPTLVGVVLSRTDLEAGVHETQAAFNSASNAKQDVTIAALDRAHSRFRSAERKAANPFTHLSSLVPVVSQHREAMADTTHTAVRVTGVARTSARQADYNQLRYRAGHLDTNKLAAMTPPLIRLRDTLAVAEQTTKSLSNPWLVAPLDHRIHKFTNEIDNALPDARLAARASQVAPAMLGANGARHYLVAFMTPAEQRGLGGFIGAWGELVADHGELHLVKHGSAGDWFRAAPKGARHINGPPDYVARYRSFGIEDSPADAFFSPDFPSDADVLAQLYPQSGGVPVDGVLALDPDAMAALTKITGPIRVPGRAQPLTSKNMADFLLRGQYIEFPQKGTNQAERHDLLQDVMQVTFDKLTNGTLPGPRTLATLMSPQMHQGRILFWSRHPDEQALIDEIGLDGTFPGAEAAEKGQDLLGVTTQNEGQNKIDVYLHRTIRYDVRTDPATGNTTATATVTLINNAPAGGLPPYITGNNFGLPPGTNATYLSLYSGLGLEQATVDGVATSTGSSREAGANAYGLSVAIPPGGTKTVVFKLTGVLQAQGRAAKTSSGHRAAPDSYQLVLWPQPMVNPDHVDVHVAVTPGWHLTGRPGFTGTLARDKTFTVGIKQG